MVHDLLDHVRRERGRKRYWVRYCSRATEKEAAQGRDYVYAHSQKSQYHPEVGASDILLQRFLNPTMKPLPPATSGGASQQGKSAETFPDQQGSG